MKFWEKINSFRLEARQPHYPDMLCANGMIHYEKASNHLAAFKRAKDGYLGDADLGVLAANIKKDTGNVLGTLIKL